MSKTPLKTVHDCHVPPLVCARSSALPQKSQFQSFAGKLFAQLHSAQMAARLRSWEKQKKNVNIIHYFEHLSRIEAFVFPDAIAAIPLRKS